MRLLLPALLTAACLLCACAPVEPAPSSASSGSSSPPQASTSQPKNDASQEEATYTEADVQAAFNRSSEAENAIILDCVVAEDQAYDLMGVVQYLNSEEPETCWLGFVSTDGIVHSAGPQAQPADDDSLTYLGDGVVSFHLYVVSDVKGEAGVTDQHSEMQLYKLSYRKDGTDITFTALGSGGEETELTPEA